MLMQNDVVDDLLLADAHLLKMMRIALKRGEAARAWDYATLLYFPKYSPPPRPVRVVR
jgi:hypothetical protein